MVSPALPGIKAEIAAKSDRAAIHLDQERYYPLYLVLLSALVFLTGLGARDFWAPVEPRYGEIVRIMWTKNEWIVPSVNGALYTDKPILYFWLALFFSKLAGAVNEWTVRLPAALGAIGLVLATYKIGKDFYTPRVGLIAGAVIATAGRMIWEGRWAHLDSLFTFFFTLSMYYAARAVVLKKNPNQLLLAYALMALATLTKGLIGVVLPGLVLVLFVIARWDWSLIRAARLPAGIAIFFLVAAPWFALVNQATDGKWLTDFFYLHHVQRYTAGLGHREPAYYYLKTLPLDFLPWTIFCIPALFTYATDAKWFRQPARLFFTLWFSVVFVFFSASDTKRDLYLLPLFAPLALFVANYIEDLTSGGLPRERWFRNILTICFSVVGLACLAAPAVVWSMRRDAFSPLLPIIVVMFVGCVWIVYSAWRQSARQVCVATCTTWAIALVAAAFWLFPFFDRFKSPRPVANEIVRRLPATTPLFIYADTMHDYNFYTGREVIPVIPAGADLAKLRAENSSGYLLIKAKDLRDLGTETKGMIEIDRRAAGRSWYLMPLKQIAP